MTVWREKLWIQGTKAIRKDAVKMVEAQRYNRALPEAVKDYEDLARSRQDSLY